MLTFWSEVPQGMNSDCQRCVTKHKHGCLSLLYPEWSQVLRPFGLGNKVSFAETMQALLNRLNHKQFLAYPQAS